MLYMTVGRLEEFAVGTFRVKPYEWLQLLLFIGGHLAKQMNSTNVESERYSDYFNPMPVITTIPSRKKLKPDDMIGTLS